MTLDTRKKLTIISESALESRLGEVLLEFGATGYTITNARGHGSQGARHGDWSSSSNIRIECICEQSTAEAIAEHLLEKYSRNYAMVLYLIDVDVFRPERFE